MSAIVVSGALANKPGNGGNAWTRLNWVRGFQRLGFDVYLVEQIDPRACVDARGTTVPFETSINRRFFEQVITAYGLADHAVLMCGDTGITCGMSTSEIEAVADGAGLLFDVGGHLARHPLRRRFRRSAYFDDDPGYAQFWHEAGTIDLRGYDTYFTVAANIGESGCAIPTGEVRWHHVRPPVALGDWPVAASADPDLFTTVASWRGAYGAVTHGGVTYGLKVHEFRKVAQLPQRAPQRFQLALDIDPADSADIELLHRNGWQVVDPGPIAGDPDRYRRYIQSSGGEFSAAQGIYVETQSGWFSDRSACYLASGKPVLVQETGFSRTIPVGEGLLSFRCLDEAVSGAQSIARDYRKHARAARALAERFFDADTVVRQVIDRAEINP